MTEVLVPEYTVLSVLSVLAVVAAERFWLRTGVFRQAQYWAALGIIAAFQVLVDGWLTKLYRPVVFYDTRQTIGLRMPWDIPVEDFLFGFSMVTLAILLWVRQGQPARPTGRHSTGGGSAAGHTTGDQSTGGRDTGRHEEDAR